MCAMASKNSDVSIVSSTVGLSAYQRKYQGSASGAFVIGEFPAQRVSNAENISIWWRHHDMDENGHSPITKKQ